MSTTSATIDKEDKSQSIPAACAAEKVQAPSLHSADPSSSPPAVADNVVEYGDFDDATADLEATEDKQAVTAATISSETSPGSQHSVEYRSSVPHASVAAAGAPAAVQPTAFHSSAEAAEAKHSNIPSTSQALGAAVSNVVVDDDEDDFGDFDTAPAAPPSSTPAVSSATLSVAAVPVHAEPTTTSDAELDDFGDFDEASEAQEVAAPTVVQPPIAQQPAAAPAETPDILQLSGSQFLSAVLDAWQVLGAPSSYKAAASQQPYQQTLEQQQTPPQPMVTVTLPPSPQDTVASSILTHNGLPVKVIDRTCNSSTAGNGNSSSRGGDPSKGPLYQETSCGSNLDWQGSAAEARLVEGLGLTPAVQRALTQQGKGAASQQRQQQQQLSNAG